MQATFITTKCYRAEQKYMLISIPLAQLLAGAGSGVPAAIAAPGACANCIKDEPAHAGVDVVLQQELEAAFGCTAETKLARSSVPGRCTAHQL